MSFLIEKIDRRIAVVRLRLRSAGLRGDFVSFDPVESDIPNQCTSPLTREVGSDFRFGLRRRRAYYRSTYGYVRVLGNPSVYVN